MITIANANALHIPLPDRSVQCIVTSPPYYGQRDYGTAKWEGGSAECDHIMPSRADAIAAVATSTLGGGKETTGHQREGYAISCAHCGARRIDAQIGLEATPAAYVASIVAVMRECKRVLRDDGTLWLNLGSSYSSLTIMSQYYIMRHDISTDEVLNVAMEMFGVRIDGYEAESKRLVQDVLSQKNGCALEQGTARMEGRAIEKKLQETSSRKNGQAERDTSRIEVDGDREIGREVRVLRGNDEGISNDRPHQQRRSAAQEVYNRKQQGELSTDLQGHQESRIPEGQVSNPVYELQLLSRVLGILSSHHFDENEIPYSVRFAFTQEIDFKPKDEIDIPNLVCEALRRDGWYRRQTIVWSKPNPMPESVTDRCTKAHEYIFLLTKWARYYYDAEAIAEQASNDSGFAKQRASGFDTWSYGRAAGGTGIDNHNGIGGTFGDGATRNRRSVWTVATQPYSGAHFAVWPPKLIEPMILAGTSARGECPHCGKAWVRDIDRVANYEKRQDRGQPDGVMPQVDSSGWRPPSIIDNGWRQQCACPPHEPIPQTVLDPFAGSGTTGAVAVKHGRRAVLLDLNTKYIDLQFERTNGVQMAMPE